MPDTRVQPQPASVTARAMESSNLPTLASPSGTKTPPTIMNRHHVVNGQAAIGTERAGSEPVDPSALSKALKDMEEIGRARERTPGASPSRKRQRVYGDRWAKKYRNGRNNAKVIAVTDSLQTEKARISRLASASFTTTHRQPRHRRSRGGRLMESSISKRVCPHRNHGSLYIQYLTSSS